jgi:hypothetical protein
VSWQNCRITGVWICHGEPKQIQIQINLLQSIVVEKTLISDVTFTPTWQLNKQPIGFDHCEQVSALKEQNAKLRRFFFRSDVKNCQSLRL